MIAHVPRHHLTASLSSSKSQSFVAKEACPNVTILFIDAAQVATTRQELESLWQHNRPQRIPNTRQAHYFKLISARAKNILRYLKEYENVQFMHFLCDALEPVSRLSLKFQEDQLTPGIYYFYYVAVLVEAIKSACVNTIKTQHTGGQNVFSQSIRTNN